MLAGEVGEKAMKWRRSAGHLSGGFGGCGRSWILGGGGVDFLGRRSVGQKDIYEERYQQQKTFSCARYPPDGRKKSGI